MEQIESLYNWLEMNYTALAQSYADWENPKNLPFALYCVAMYVKHASLTK
jgi:hypothetical protein